ncbi:uncharacterized protein Dana_GF18776 [Drosophila ananassae]|uniref:Peptidase S1 domain-containing protein n=1 Tax=Drosophila ananassae TaxID=7217 RepID=B3LYB2_DROAN|nr:serine protease gd [Drosophila ananassae]EDV44016.2 uncharacterized protein Dana_GF18776 [Drosophila ananassae]
MKTDGLTFLGLSLTVSLGWALIVPQHHCENYFSYMKESNGKYFGLFTAPRGGINSVKWVAVFNADKTQQSHTVGSLELYPDKDQAFRDLRNGERTKVSVDFHDYGNKLPKLIRAEFNEELLCSNPEYDAPSSTMTRERTFSTSGPVKTQTVYSQPYPRPPQSQPLPQNNYKSNPFLPSTPFVNRPATPEVKPRIEGDFDECGREGFAFTQIGGTDVVRGQYPWLSALYVGTTRATYSCVTSVISKRTVITAAHCIFGKQTEELWVYLGRHDRDKNPEDGAKLVGVSSVHTPDEYKDNRLPHTDVGLLILAETIEYTRYIRPLCMWTSDMNVPRNEGDSGVVAGWGLDIDAQKTRFPRMVTVNLVSRTTCRNKMGLAEDFITDRTVCAGNSLSHGPCFGDSGGALMILRNNRWVVRGIVSLSPRKGEICDLSNYVIYCDVTKYLTWIRRNMVS